MINVRVNSQKSDIIVLFETVYPILVYGKPIIGSGISLVLIMKSFTYKTIKSTWWRAGEEEIKVTFTI